MFIENVQFALHWRKEKNCMLVNVSFSIFFIQFFWTDWTMAWWCIWYWSLGNSSSRQQFIVPYLTKLQWSKASVNSERANLHLPSRALNMAFRFIHAKIKENTLQSLYGLYSFNIHRVSSAFLTPRIHHSCSAIFEASNKSEKRVTF